MRPKASVIIRNVAFYASAVVGTLGHFPMAVGAYLGLVTWDRLAESYLGMIARLLDRICGIRVEVTGMDNIPPGVVLFAPAQQCTWENFYFPMMFGNPVLLVKNEIRAYPIVSRVARERGYIFANRGKSHDIIRETFVQAKAAAAGGRSVMLFPTGWRTGTEMSPRLQNGIAMLYRMLDAPCVPIAHNAGLCWPHGSWLRYPGTIRVHVLPPLQPGLDKKTFVETLHASLFGAADDLLAAPPSPAILKTPDDQTKALARSIAAEAGV